MSRFDLSFSSTLAAAPEQVWRWITSVDGISKELWPLLKMTVPRGFVDITSVRVEPGKPLFRSWVLLFGIVPVDRSDLTLESLDTGRGFVEESPMLGMRLWRHERRLEPQPRGTVLTDRLTFEPRVAAPLVRWFIGSVFKHRHLVLQRALGRRTDANPGS